MKIYLAGSNAMPKTERERVYQIMKYRLLSFFETLPRRFAFAQWKWIIDENLLLKHDGC